MLHFNNVSKIVNVNNLEQLVLFLGVPIFLLLLIMKFSILITINYHKNNVNNNKLIRKGKTIVIQFLLWFLAQICLFLLPIKELSININLFDLQTLPVLTIITFLHLTICFSFLINKNNHTIKYLRFIFYIFIIGAIIFQFNLTMINLSLTTVTNVISLISWGFFYYILLFCATKMFTNNLSTLFTLIKKTCYIFFMKSPVPNIINGQQPVKIYYKTKLILLTWQFEKQSTITNNNKIMTNQKLLVAASKKTLVYFMLHKLVINVTKTIQDLKTLVNGWKIREIQ